MTVGNREAADRAVQLAAALTDLERALQKPVVPGELPEWTDEARSACQRVGPILRERLHHDQPALLQQILQQDAELSAHVSHLETEMRAIEEEQAALLRALDDFSEVAGRIEPRESKFVDHVQQLIDRGLGQVLRIRKQETSVETWYLEAFLRDRGVKD